MKVIEEKDFEEEIKTGLVLVDFFATWCGPCRAMAGVLEEVEGQLNGKAKIIKVDTDKCENLASNFAIMSIPTLIIFKEGVMVDKFVGFMQADELLEKIQLYI